MSQTYGWFEFDYDKRCVSRHSTNQRLFSNPRQIDGDVKSYELVYEDSDLRQSLNLTVSKEPTKRIALTIDYSAANFHPTHYGVWRRIDDYVIDALLCWPILVGCKSAFMIDVTGGWLHGQWVPTHKRRFLSGLGVDYKRAHEFPVADPILAELDMSSPLEWEYVDCSNPQPSASLEYELLPEINVPYLPIDRPITGFQGQVPYLKREDGNAFIFFSKLDPDATRDREPFTNLFYTYVDGEIFFTFRTHPFYHIELGSCSYYGYRNIPPPPELWTRRHVGGIIQWDMPRSETNVLAQYGALSYPVWLKMLHTLSEAWLMWPKPGRSVSIDDNDKLPDFMGRAGFIGDYGPHISSGYSGGITNHAFSLYLP